MRKPKTVMRFKMLCTGLLLLLLGCAQVNAEKDEAFAFGAIADCQYCNDPGKGVRKYAQSTEKLSQCVAAFNTMDLSYVVHLGDFIDRDFKSFDAVMPIYKRLKMPAYHVLGNHDFSVADARKKEVPKKMGMPSKYYDFAVKGWRYVVLDGNDISFHAYPKDSPGHAQAATYYRENKISSPKWNGAIGSKQLSWLRGVLKNATNNKENVILFCHFPVYPDNSHNLWNATELIALIEPFACVKAYINGHNHKGGYGEKSGIHYLTLKGMVDTTKTSYAVIQSTKTHIKVTGYGREQNRTLPIRK